MAGQGHDRLAGLLALSAPTVRRFSSAGRQRTPREEASGLPPAAWLTRHYPQYATAPLAPHHEAVWAWLDALREGEPPEQHLLLVLARGGAKSTTAELAVVRAGHRRTRSYVLYVSGTQAKADGHVATIASMLESEALRLSDPELGERKLSRFGQVRGYRRNRLWTAAGLVVDAIGLDTGVRGVKVENQRPDLIVLDDVDDRHDSPDTVSKKLEAISESLLPAGSPACAVVGIQNLIHRDGVFAQMLDGRSTVLARRATVGPVPALREFHVEHTEQGPRVHGVPTWAGQDLATCQRQVDAWGLKAFRREAQHEVDEVEGAMWTQAQLDFLRRDRPPAQMERVVVAVDVSGAGEQKVPGRHDEVGLVAAGRAAERLYYLDDVSAVLAPAAWGRRAVELAVKWEADAFVYETNFGGGMVRAILEQAMRDAGVWFDIVPVTASRAKKVRAEPIAALFGEPDKPETWRYARAHIVGRLAELERELTGWSPQATWSPNRLDAAVWAGHDLLLAPEDEVVMTMPRTPGAGAYARRGRA